MKLLLIAIGKSHDPAIKTGIEDFTDRIRHVFPVEWALVPSDSIEKEATKILKLIKPDDYVVLLDERGTQFSSPEVAKLMEGRMNAGVKRVVFIIGGAYGVDATIQKAANTTWSLSRLVFPHQIVRLLLTEQIYRALSIVRGEKYHHE